MQRLKESHGDHDGYSVWSEWQAGHFGPSQLISLEYKGMPQEFFIGAGPASHLEIFKDEDGVYILSWGDSCGEKTLALQVFSLDGDCLTTDMGQEKVCKNEEEILEALDQTDRDVIDTLLDYHNADDELAEVVNKLLAYI